MIEDEFEALLKRLTPSHELRNLMEYIFRDGWEQQRAAIKTRKASMKQEIARIDGEIAKWLDRIIKTETQTVIKTYENSIANLEERKLLLDEKIERCGTPMRGYDESFRTAMDFLGSPWNLWTSDRLEDKQTVIKLAFADKLSWKRGEGLRTPQMSIPFKALQDFSCSKEQMARPERFERPTLRFVVHFE